ncbi:MAG TPA: carbohydrate kinase family protein [Rickettsiales bacterium]|nr:carbohydrate kinase family protein [Rickettsiales bacterium]
MVNILSSDLLIADVPIPLPSPEELRTAPAAIRDRYAELNTVIDKVLAEHDARRGEKVSLTKEEFDTISRLTQGLKMEGIEPGGSTANTLVTFKRLMGHNAHLEFLGVAGHGVYSDSIKNDIKGTGTHLLPAQNEIGNNAEPAVSFIFTAPDGSHTLATYPGNADQLLKPGMITDELVRKNDVVFIPSSLWGKLGNEFPDTLLTKALANDKRVVATLPKQAQFGHPVPPGTYQKLLENADVIVGDEQELTRIYDTGHDFDLAAKKLLADMEERDKLRAQAGKPARNRAPAALIVRSDNSTVLLTGSSAPGVTPVVAAGRTDFPAVKKSIGSADSAYAGFIAGYVSGLSPQQSAKMALDVARTKSGYNDVRIPDTVSMDPATKENWQNIQGTLGKSLENASGELLYALTGVQGKHEDKKKMNFAQRAFDAIVYGVLLTSAVAVTSAALTFYTTYGSDKSAITRGLRTRGNKSREWTANQLENKLHMSPERSASWSKGLMMVLWSWLDGSVFAFPVAALEKKRQAFIDKFGNKEDKQTEGVQGNAADKPAEKEEAQKISLGSILGGRLATALTVIPIAMLLGRERKGGTQKSWNATLFEDTGAKMGQSAFVTKMFPKLAQKTVTSDTGAQIPLLKAVGEIVAFEGFYSFVCAVTLRLFGGFFENARGKHNHKSEAPQSAAATGSSQPGDIQVNAPHTQAESSLPQTPSFEQRFAKERTTEENGKKLYAAPKSLVPEKQSDSFIGRAEEQKLQAASAQPTLH